MQFETAVRQSTPVIVSLAGRSGSGKTLSGLYMARGLAGPDGKIFVLDTENKRSLIYAGDHLAGPYQVGHLYPPFTAESYVKAIEAAERAGADVIVIDSMSHEWSGIGGCLEQAEALDPTGRLGPLAWGKVKASHRRLVNRLLLAQCHVICCLRADYKLVAYKDDRGKQQFAESAELVPEQEKRFIYEMTLSAVIGEDHKARWVKLPKPLVGALQDGDMIGVATGEAVRAWVEGGQAIDRETERMLAVGRDVASLGMEALRQHYRGLDKAARARIDPHLDSLKAIAEEADRIAQETVSDETDPLPDLIEYGAGNPPPADDDLFGGPVPTATPADERQTEYDDLVTGLRATRQHVDDLKAYLSSNAKRIQSMSKARQDLADAWLKAVDEAYDGASVLR